MSCFSYKRMPQSVHCLQINVEGSLPICCGIKLYGISKNAVVCILICIYLLSWRIQCICPMTNSPYITAMTLISQILFLGTPSRKLFQSKIKSQQIVPFLSFSKIQGMGPRYMLNAWKRCLNNFRIITYQVKFNYSFCASNCTCWKPTV